MWGEFFAGIRLAIIARESKGGITIRKVEVKRYNDQWVLLFNEEVITEDLRF